MQNKQLTRKITTIIETIEPDGSIHPEQSTFKIVELTDVTKSNKAKMDSTVGVFGQRRMCAVCGEGAVYGIAKESSDYPQWMHEKTRAVSQEGHRICPCSWDEDKELLAKFKSNPIP